MLWCVYHKSLPMRVVDAAGFEKHLASGEWFDHPNKVNEVTHERQIRRRKRKGIGNDELPNGPIECGTQC
jgi:hypothetical protein